MLFTTLTLAMATIGQGPADWHEPFPAHQVVGNVYYVGSKDLAQLVDNQDYPEIADDFAKTFEVLKSLPCDVFLGAHGGYYAMTARYDLLISGRPNAFVNADGYKKYVAEKEQAFHRTLAEQRRKAEAEKGQ